jgi:hypothetical protein
MATCPTHPNFLHLINRPKYIRRTVKLIVKPFAHSPFSSLLEPNIHLKILFSKLLIIDFMAQESLKSFGCPMRFLYLIQFSYTYFPLEVD